MGFDDLCTTGLVLRLGFSSESTTASKVDDQKYSDRDSIKLDRLAKMASILEPSLTLSLPGEETTHDLVVRKLDLTPVANIYRQDSIASSFSNGSTVKREREIGGDEGEMERLSSKASDEDDDVNGRKKLRLSKAQSAILEECFKQHSSLNPKQKQELARELKLRPRQVEVWFQNRRARTKLKQTEVDCEFLKKCCETLTDENRRLQKELQELKAVKLAQPFYMQLPAATLTMCPSCERISNGVVDNTSKSRFTMAPKPHHLYNSFPNPSAAC